MCQRPSAEAARRAEKPNQAAEQSFLLAPEDWLTFSFPVLFKAPFGVLKLVCPKHHYRFLNMKDK